jgi:hypothetical protein
MHRLILIVFIITGCSTTQPIPVFDQEQHELTCIVDNKPIKTIPSFETKRISRLVYATFNRELKRREIVFSVLVLDNAPTDILEFISYHECAHHQLDHVDTSDIPKQVFLWSGQMIKEENEADCFAAEMFQQNNGSEKFHNLLSSLDKFGLPYERIKRINNCNR